MLIKVAKLFNIELSELTSDYNKQLNSDLMDIFSDTIFEEHDLKNIDVKEFSMNSPIVGDAVRSLYQKYLQNKKDLALLSDQIISVKQDISSTSESAISSADLVSDILQSNNNFFLDLEDIATKEADMIDMKLETDSRA